MKTLEEYIRKDNDFRQELLKMDGGIMKYWAEHPDNDFDSKLFANYEKQIVDFYLQVNKRNRDVASLSDNELIVNARNWYRFTEKELHFYIVLQPILTKMPKEVREQANHYIEDYLADAYRDYRRNYYPNGITPMEFYNEVVNLYGPGGLARDCMDFILREHHNPQVWLKKKGEYFLLRDFFIQQYSEVIEEEGGYRKLRQAVKEMLDGKNPDECRREAIKTMNLVKYFSRMIYSSAEVTISDCTGEYVVDKNFLRNVASWEGHKISPLNECFFKYVLMLNDIGRIWAAQLLIHGIDMHELEKETGSILFPVSEPTQWPDGNNYGNYRYYVDKYDFNPLDNECCVYDKNQAKELLDVIIKKHGNNPPKVLLSDEAKPYWAKLREKGFISTEGYALIEGISPYDATYIADHFSVTLNIKYKWKVFESLWGLKLMAQNKNDYTNKTANVPHQKEIDEIFGVKPKKLEKI